MISNTYLKNKLKSQPWIDKYFINRDIKNDIAHKQNQYEEDCRTYGFRIQDTISAAQLKESLIASRGKKDTCNIIGSGKSAVKAKYNYNEHESYYLCNFSGLLDIKSDVYMFEVGTYTPCNQRIADVSELLKEVILNRQHVAPVQIVKNLWQGHIGKAFLDEHYSKYFLLRDIYMPSCGVLETKGYLDLLFKWMFNDQLFFVLQVHTTVLTLVQLAVWAGYKTINIYGLEGRGSHFFHYDNVVQDKTLFKRLNVYMPAVSEDFIHIPGYRARNLIEPMASYLKKNHQVELKLMGQMPYKF